MTRKRGVILLSLLGLAGAAHAETVSSVTQVNYDAVGRVNCTATRMNPATYTALPADACALGTAGTYGNDRISQTKYDAAGQVTEVDRSVGDLNQIYARYTYTLNGQKASETDANGNKTTFIYDGFDRLSQMQYPSPTVVGSSNVNDYEAFSYDANGNRLSWRRRNGYTIGYSYDALNRVTYENVPVSPGNANGTDKDITKYYDLLGNPTYAYFGNGSYSFRGYDGLGRLNTTIDVNGRQQWFYYNRASALTTQYYNPSTYIAFNVDNLNRPTSAWTNTSDPLYAITYDDLGRRSSLNKGVLSGAGAVNVTYGYDPVGRLTSQTNDLAATANDVTYGFSYSPASQILSQTTTGGAYDYKELDQTTDNRTYNGLNQDSSIAALSGGYDANGNMANDGNRVMTYDVYNRLISVTGTGVNLSLDYDPEGRLSKTISNGVTTTFGYAGTNLLAEYDGAGNMLRRYIHGPGTDEPVVWYEGSTYATKRYFVQNYQGSVIGYTDASGTLTEMYKYGPWGEPLVANPATPNTVAKSFAGSRFRYTGQTALTEASLYYYKARVYDPIYGRFLQTDPIGSKDDLDLYDYTADDPVNKSDPTGETCDQTGSDKNGNATYSCHLDDTANLSDKQVDKINQAYTDATNAASARGDQTEDFSYRGDDGKMVNETISGRELARSLADRVMIADPFDKHNRDENGNVNSNANSGTRGVTYLGSGAIGENGWNLRRTIAHEGAHQTSSENNGRRRSEVERHAKPGWYPSDDDSTQKKHWHSYDTGAECLIGDPRCPRHKP